METGESDEQARQLARALSMKHPFKRFRMALADIGITDEWYTYKAEEYLWLAKERLEWSSVDFGVKGSDTSVYVLLYMLDRGESEVTGSAAVCVADCVADLVYYAAKGERLWDL